MKNLLPYLKTESEIDNAIISRGKMPPRCGWKSSKYKKEDAKARRGAMKRGSYSVKSQFGTNGHSSWWG